MVKNCIKMYSAATAAASNIATIIIPVTSQLVLIEWNAVLANVGAVGAAITYQLSSMSVGQFAQNDARGIIDEFSVGHSPTANVFYTMAKNTAIPGLKVNSGDQIWLHLATSNVATTSVINVNLFFV